MSREVVDVPALEASLAAALAELQVVDTEGRVVVAGESDVEADGRSALRDALQYRLYERLHTGRTASSDAEGLPRSWRDPVFEERLVRATPHQNTVRAAWLGRPGEGPGGTTIAILDGVRFALNTERVISPPPDGGQEARSGLVRVPAARPGLSPGFFLADASGGRRDAEVTLRVYLHVPDAESAPEVWGAVLGHLEEVNASYRAKIGSNPGLFPRRDAMVVYLSRSSWGVLGSLVSTASDLPWVGDETSLLARSVAPGVGIAFEPEDTRPGWHSLSFGEHRCRAIADGLISHAAGDCSPETSAEGSVADALRQAGVDPAAPWRALDSPPVPLEVLEA